MNKSGFLVKSVYRRHMEGFGLSYETKRFNEPDLSSALDRIASEIGRDDIKEVSLEDLSKPVKNVKEYPVYGKED